MLLNKVCVDIECLVIVEWLVYYFSVYFGIYGFKVFSIFGVVLVIVVGVELVVV